MKPNPISRFALNFVVYLVFGGGIFAFVSMRDPATAHPPLSSVVVAAVCLAVWSGALTTIIELVVASNQPQLRRTAVAGVLGALSLGGFATILSLLAWQALPLGFVAIGVCAGALMHAARAFSRGQPLIHPPDEDASRPE